MLAYLILYNILIYCILYIFLYFIPTSPPHFLCRFLCSLTFNPIILQPEDSVLATHLPHIFFLQNSPSQQSYPHCVLPSSTPFSSFSFSSCSFFQLNVCVLQLNSYSLTIEALKWNFHEYHGYGYTALTSRLRCSCSCERATETETEREVEREREREQCACSIQLCLGRRCYYRTESLVPSKYLWCVVVCV